MVLIFKDNETGQEVGRIFASNETYRRLAPIYDPDAFPGSQNIETFLVSIKGEDIHSLAPILEFNNLWSEVYADETSFVQLYSNSSHFELKSGISNGVEVVLDLEIFDSADIGEIGEWPWHCNRQ